MCGGGSRACVLVEAAGEVSARGPSEEKLSTQVGSWARLWLPSAEGLGAAELIRVPRQETFAFVGPEVARGGRG